MADYYSTALAGLQSNPQELASRQDLWGDVQSVTFDVEPGAAVAVSDRLILARLPKRARIVGGTIEVTNAFGSVTSNAKVGTTSDDDAIAGANALNLATAGQWQIDRAARGQGYTAPDYEDVFVTVQAIASAVTTGRIRGTILYVN